MARLVSIVCAAVVGMLCVAAGVAAAPTKCGGSTPNTHTLYTDAPVLVGTVANGKLFTVGPADNTIDVVHVYGTPYEMGKAQGQLVADKYHELFADFLKWIENMVVDSKYAKHIPKIIVDTVVEFGIEAALELEVIATDKYTPGWFKEELHGLADGLGVSYSQVAQLNQFSELIRAACTIVAANNTATANGGLVQLRALDWGVDNPMRMFPTAVIYHPNSDNGHAFYTQTFPGIIGALTGYSDHVAICEKVWIHSNDTVWGNRFGTPWAVNLREVLQYRDTVEDALAQLQASKRTCSIFVGLGDHATGTGVIVEYSDTELNVFHPDTPFPGYAPSPAEHPIIPDVVYADKHSQPSGSPCLASILQDQHGSMSIDSVRTNLVSIEQSGDLQCAIYDFKANVVQVAVATQDPAATGSDILPAYDRQFIQLDMTALFSEPAPN